jgi:hypothetical protein
VIFASGDIAQDALEALAAESPTDTSSVLGEGHSAPDLEFRAKSGLDTFPPTHPDA